MAGYIDASRVSGEKYIYLTTTGRRTRKPHTVELWFATANRRIYLSHEGKYTDWMRNILKNDQVEFRTGCTHFEGKTHIIKSGKIFETGKLALYLKYYGEAKREVIDDWFSESTIIEISNIREKSTPTK